MADCMIRNWRVCKNGAVLAELPSTETPFDDHKTSFFF